MGDALEPPRRSGRTLTASIVLVAFVSRALIPPGFMPASDRPFSIEICWEVFPADMLAHGEPTRAGSMGLDSMKLEAARDFASHRDTFPGAQHHHSGSPSHIEHCVFGTACGTGPIPHLPLLGDSSSAQQLPTVEFASIAGAVRLVYLPQSRAPRVG
jgi:hypothetical protein